ncbi:MAG: DNA alkylation repair protein, partial [Bacteroidota bacterium]
MAEPLKNRYNQTFFDALIRDFQRVYPEFPPDFFLQKIYDAEWEGRELKDRLRHITHCLHA